MLVTSRLQKVRERDRVGRRKEMGEKEEGERSKMRRKGRGDKIYPTKAWAQAQGPTSSTYSSLHQ